MESLRKPEGFYNPSNPKAKGVEKIDDDADEENENKTTEELPIIQ